VQVIVALRRLRFTGPEIAEVLGMAVLTVSGILTRIGIGKLGRVGPEPAQRYERARPGELIQIEIKKLGRIERGAGARVVGIANRASRPRRRDAAGVDRQIAGWEYVQIAIDDCSRLPTPKFCQPQAPNRGRVPQSSGPPLRPARSHRRAGAEATTAPPTARRFTRSPAARCASATCAHGPTGPRPKA
jgi:hypothetical protein